MGGGASKKIKDWWRGGPDLAKALEQKALRDIPDEVHKMRVMSEKVATKMDNALQKATDRLFQSTKSLDSKIHEQVKEKGRIERLLLAYRARLDKSKEYFAKQQGKKEPFTSAHEAEQTIRGMEKSVAAMEKQLAEVTAIRDHYMIKRKALGDLDNAIHHSPQQLVQQLERSPQMLNDFPSLKYWMRQAERYVPRQHQIAQSTSRFINNDKKFIKEYMTEIYPSLNNKSLVYPQNWMANPKNARKLMELRANKKYMAKILELERGAEFRARLEGLTSSQIARKLKIVGGVGVGLGGAVAFMTWFDDNAEPITKSSNETETGLSTFKASGEGDAIVKETLRASREIAQITAKTEDGLGVDPAKAGPEFVKSLLENKAIIDKNLARWDIVISNADDPEAAKRAQKLLQKQSNSLDKSIKEMGEKTGVSKGRSGGQAGNVPIGMSRGNIKGVQSFLRPRFPTVAPTGNLDAPTIRALRALEQEYDRLGDTNGRIVQKRLLVRPKEGHLIGLEDLRKLDNLISKHR
jgi:hypothetical protein